MGKAGGRDGCPLQSVGKRYRIGFIADDVEVRGPNGDVCRKWSPSVRVCAGLRDPIFVNNGEPLYHLTFDGELPCEEVSAVDWHEEGEAMRTSPPS
jgi:hypothetical protein